MSFDLPLFTLGTLVFPGGRLPLRVFEQRYLDMVKQAIADDTPFGVCAIRSGAETGTPALPHAVGTQVRVVDWDMPQTGILHIETLALERFVIRDTEVTPGGLLIGSVDRVNHETAVAVPDELDLAVEVLRHIVGEYGETRFPPPHPYNDAVWVGYRLAEALPLSLTIKQNMLEMNDAVTRLRLLCEFLKKHIN